MARCSGPFDLCATFATTTRKEKLGQQGGDRRDGPPVRLSLKHVAIARGDPDDRWRLGSDRLMIGVYDQESLGGDKAVGVGIVHLTQVNEHWGSYAWLNLYGLRQRGTDSVFDQAIELLGQAWAKVSDKQRKLIENRDMVRKGELPGVTFTGRIRIRLEWKEDKEVGLLGLIPCCKADDTTDGPAAPTPGSETSTCTQVGFRFRSLVLQAGSLPKVGTYSVELSCGVERVESIKLHSDGTCANWWASCGSGHGVELEPLDYRRLSIHDVTQVPDLFVSLKCGTARVGFVRLDPQSLAPGEDLSFEIAEWHLLHRDPDGPVPVGSEPGSVLLAVSIEPIFSRGDTVDTVDLALSAGRAHRKRKPTAPRRRSTMSPSRSPRKHDVLELSMLDATQPVERSIQADRRTQLNIEHEIRDKKRTLRLLEEQSSTQLDVTVVQAKGIKDTQLFGSAAGQYFADVSIGTPGGKDRIRRRTQPSTSPGVDPVWDQGLRYEVVEASSAKLTVQVFSSTTGKEDRLLGKTESIELRPVLRDRQVEGWWPLNDGACGQVFLRVSAHSEAVDAAVSTELVDNHRAKLHELEQELAQIKSRLRSSGYISASPSRHNWSIGAGGAAAPSLTRYMLDVHVYQARNLPPVDSDGNTNALVRVAIGNEVQETRVRKALVPRWYETMHFELELPQSRELMRVWPPQLVLSLLHMPESIMPATPELLGKLHLELDPAAVGEPTERSWETFTRYNAAVEESRPVTADLLLSYELTEMTRSRAGSRQQENVIELDTATHAVSVLVIGCRGLQPKDTLTTPIPELTFTVPGVDPDDRPQQQHTLRPRDVSIRDIGNSEEDTDHTDPFNAMYIPELNPGASIPDTVDMEVTLPAKLFAPALVATVAGSSFGRTVPIGTATINLGDFMEGGCKTATARKERRDQRVIDRKSLRSSQLVASSRMVNMRSTQSALTSTPIVESYRVDDLEYGSLSRDSTAGLIDNSSVSSRKKRMARSDSTSDESDDDAMHSDTDTTTDVELQSGSQPPRWDWRQGRKILRTALESWLIETPIISFPLHCKAATRTDGGGIDPALRDACGVLKAAIVVSPPNAPLQPHQIRREFQKVSPRYFQEPKKVTVFLYVIRAMHLPSDGSGGEKTNCDARLRVRLQGQLEGKTILPSDATQHSLKQGGLVYDDSPQVHAVDGAPASSTDDTLNPYFGQLFTVETVLPGASRLSIELYDRKDLAEKVKTVGWAGEEIGSTVLDLEDRYFSSNWTNYCATQHQRNKSNAHAPIETRTLRRPGIALPCGQLELWVDIFDSADVAAGKRGQLEPVQYRAFRRVPELFELRVAIMDAKDMHAMEGDRNDLYFTAEVFTNKADATLQSSARKHTDTHKGTKHGSFNEWLLFKDLRLYPPVLTMPANQRQSQRLILKAWDSDTFTSDDLIASYDSAAVSAAQGSNAVFDVDKLFERATFEVSKVKPGTRAGSKKGSNAARKFGKQHVFRLPDSNVRSKQRRAAQGGTETVCKTMKSCCGKCFRRQALGRVGAEPAYVPLSKMKNGSSTPESRGAVRMHIQLMPKQLAENGQNQPKEMEKPVRDSVSWTDPLGAMSWFLPFNCSADILPCSLSNCVCFTLIGILVLVFLVSLITELPKMLIHRVFGAG
jgi:hypothetical protein